MYLSILDSLTGMDTQTVKTICIYILYPHRPTPMDTQTLTTLYIDYSSSLIVILAGMDTQTVELMYINSPALISMDTQTLCTLFS